MVDVENVLRPDEPRPSLAARARARATRPTPPTAASACRARAARERLLDLTARAGRGAHPRRRPVGAAELFDAYRERAAAEDLDAYLWVADEAPASRRPTRPLGGVPLAVKDLFCVEGVPSAGRLAHPRGLPPALHGHRRAQRLNAAGAPTLGKTNMDEFAMGSSNENSGYGPVKNPWDRDARAGRLVAAARPPRSPPGLAPWAIGTDTGGSIRQPASLCGDRRPQAHLRGRVALRDDRLRLARSTSAARSRAT